MSWSRSILPPTSLSISALRLMPSSRVFPVNNKTKSTLLSMSIISLFYSTKTKARDDKDNLQHVVIIGSGWGAFKALQEIDHTLYRVTVVSPRDYFVFTPFLTGACVGTHEDRAAIEPIRRKGRGGFSYIQACVQSMDLDKKSLLVNPLLQATSHSGTSRNEESSSQSAETSSFSISYDKLIIACGAVVNTFNTPGVPEHAHFLKDITDAQAIRSKILSLFELASLQTTAPQQRSDLLHFVVVGGGPTGVEFMGELYDLVHQDLALLFPKDMISSVRMTIFDVAPKILSTFHPSLSSWTSEVLGKKMNISLRTGTSVSHLLPGIMVMKDGEKVPFGLCLWATGVSPAPLLKQVSEDMVARDGRTGRITTDSYLRVMKKSEHSAVYPDVFAIGDCAAISNADLPPTAQVAKQKGAYIGLLLNQLHFSYPLEKISSFSYADKGYMAYVGRGKAVVGLTPPFSSSPSSKKWHITGFLGWVIWRSAYLSMLMSWRNRILVPMYWFLTLITGREVSLVRQKT